MAPFISNPSASWRPPECHWPGGKQFAFTVFDDPDFQNIERGRPVYEFLADLGFRTTRGVFAGVETTPEAERKFTCMDPEHLRWLLKLQQQGFELGWHAASPGASKRPEIEEGFERFRKHFGDWPRTIAQHYECAENLYWGDKRLVSPLHQFVYNILTRWRNHNAFHGEDPSSEYYWSDLCRERIRYVRNFVYEEINTLKACPFMPYHDNSLPDVDLWYSSTDGHNAASFVRAISEQNQDRLEAEGGACIMYAHFAYQFLENGRLQPEFKRLMERLSKKNGWFVPAGELLDYIAAQRGPVLLHPSQRQALERRWLNYKIRFGTA